MGFKSLENAMRFLGKPYAVILFPFPSHCEQTMQLANASTEPEGTGKMRNVLTPDFILIFTDPISDTSDDGFSTIEALLEFFSCSLYQYTKLMLWWPLPQTESGYNRVHYKAKQPRAHCNMGGGHVTPQVYNFLSFHSQT